MASVTLDFERDSVCLIRKHETAYADAVKLWTDNGWSEDLEEA